MKIEVENLLPRYFKRILGFVQGLLNMIPNRVAGDVQPAKRNAAVRVPHSGDWETKRGVGIGIQKLRTVIVVIGAGLGLDALPGGSLRGRARHSREH